MSYESTSTDEAMVLYAYGDAMRSAQGFEWRLKTLLGLHRIGRTVQCQDADLTDDEFEKLFFSGDNLAAGQASSLLIKELKNIGIQPLPQIAVDGLRRTIELRNCLAHQYFLYQGTLIDDPAAREHLITLLKSYSETFSAWFRVLDKWTDTLLSTLGITVDEIEDFDEVVLQFHDEFRDKLMNDLTRSVRRLAM